MDRSFIFRTASATVAPDEIVWTCGPFPNNTVLTLVMRLVLPFSAFRALRLAPQNAPVSMWQKRREVLTPDYSTKVGWGDTTL